MSSIFSDHNAVRLDINYREKKTIKNTNIWRLNNMLLNNQQIKEEIKNKIKYAQKQMKMKTLQPKTFEIQEEKEGSQQYKLTSRNKRNIK